MSQTENQDSNFNREPFDVSWVPREFFLLKAVGHGSIYLYKTEDQAVQAYQNMYPEDITREIKAALVSLIPGQPRVTALQFVPEVKKAHFIPRTR